MDGGLSNIRSITHVQVGRPRHQSEPVPHNPFGGWQAVYVPVHFDMTQYHPVEMPNGPQPYGYVLRRQTDSQPWRIIDQGNG